MQPRFTYTLHVLSALIACLCVVVLGLTTHAIILSSRLSTPPNVNGTTQGLLMWPGVGGIVDALLFLSILIAGEKRHFKTPRARQVHDHGFLFVGSFILFRPLVVTIYEFVAYNQANQVNPTTETWACGMDGADAHAICNDLRVGRWLLVPMIVIAAAFTATVIWAWLHRKEEREEVFGRNGGESVVQPDLEASREGSI